jgi:hypothetical protein
LIVVEKVEMFAQVSSLFLATTASTHVNFNDRVEQMCLSCIGTQYAAFGTNFFGKDSMIVAVNVNRRTIMRQKGKVKDQMDTSDLVWLVSLREWNKYSIVLATKKTTLKRHGKSVIAGHPSCLSSQELVPFIEYFCGKFIAPSSSIHSQDDGDRNGEQSEASQPIIIRSKASTVPNVVDYVKPTAGVHTVKWVDEAKPPSAASSVSSVSSAPTTSRSVFPRPRSTGIYNSFNGVYDELTPELLQSEKISVSTRRQYCSRCHKLLDKGWRFVNQGIGMCVGCMKSRDMEQTVVAEPGNRADRSEQAQHTSNYPLTDGRVGDDLDHANEIQSQVQLPYFRNALSLPSLTQIRQAAAVQSFRPQAQPPQSDAQLQANLEHHIEPRRNTYFHHDVDSEDDVPPPPPSALPPRLSSANYPRNGDSNPMRIIGANERIFPFDECALSAIAGHRAPQGMANYEEAYDENEHEAGRSLDLHDSPISTITCSVRYSLSPYSPSANGSSRLNGLGDSKRSDCNRMRPKTTSTYDDDEESDSDTVVEGNKTPNAKRAFSANANQDNGVGRQTGKESGDSPTDDELDTEEDVMSQAYSLYSMGAASTVVDVEKTYKDVQELIDEWKQLSKSRPHGAGSSSSSSSNDNFRRNSLVKPPRSLEIGAHQLSHFREITSKKVRHVSRGPPPEPRVMCDQTPPTKTGSFTLVSIRHTGLTYCRKLAGDHGHAPFVLPEEFNSGAVTGHVAVLSRPRELITIRAEHHGQVHVQCDEHSPYLVKETARPLPFCCDCYERRASHQTGNKRNNASLDERIPDSAMSASSSSFGSMEFDVLSAIVDNYAGKGLASSAKSKTTRKYSVCLITPPEWFHDDKVRPSVVPADPSPNYYQIQCVFRRVCDSLLLPTETALARKNIVDPNNVLENIHRIYEDLNSVQAGNRGSSGVIKRSRRLVNATTYSLPDSPPVVFVSLQSHAMYIIQQPVFELLGSPPAGSIDTEAPVDIKAGNVRKITVAVLSDMELNFGAAPFVRRTPSPQAVDPAAGPADNANEANRSDVRELNNKEAVLISPSAEARRNKVKHSSKLLIKMYAVEYYEASTAPEGPVPPPFELLLPVDDNNEPFVFTLKDKLRVVFPDRSNSITSPVTSPTSSIIMLPSESPEAIMAALSADPDSSRDDSISNAANPSDSDIPMPISAISSSPVIVIGLDYDSKELRASAYQLEIDRELVQPQDATEALEISEAEDTAMKVPDICFDDSVGEAPRGDESIPKPFAHSGKQSGASVMSALFGSLDLSSADSANNAANSAMSSARTVTPFAHLSLTIDTDPENSDGSRLPKKEKAPRRKSTMPIGNRRRSFLDAAFPQCLVPDDNEEDLDAQTLGTRATPVEFYFAPFLRLLYSKEMNMNGHVVLSYEDSICWALFQVHGKNATDNSALVCSTIK